MALAAVLVAAAGVAEATSAFNPPEGGWTYTFKGDGDANATGATLDGQWDELNRWDGSGVLQAVPGGVDALTEVEDPNDALTDYIRYQDTGTPAAHGQPNFNDKFHFNHMLERDFPDGVDPNDPNSTLTWIDDYGATISFRTRIPTPSTGGPLYSSVLPDSGDPFAWPAGGTGYLIDNDARAAMFGVAQHRLLGTANETDYYIGFSLLLKDELNAANQEAGRDPSDFGGLVMNHDWDPNVPGEGPDTDEPGDLNLVPISDAELNQWHEFWITIEADDPNDPNTTTHTVTVYMDGATEPDGTFTVRQGREGGNTRSPAIRMALSSGSQFGAYDIDFFSYTVGAFAPEAGVLLGDVNGDGQVDNQDVVPFLDHLLNGEYLPAADMNEDERLNGLDVDAFVAAVQSGGAVAGSVVIPEPSTLCLGLLVTGGLLLLRLKRTSALPLPGRKSRT